MAVALTPIYSNRTNTATPTVVGAGVTPDLTTTTFPNDGSTFLVIVNGATPATCTPTLVSGVDGLVQTGRTYTLVASQTTVLGPFPVASYGTTATFAFNNITTVKAVALGFQY